MTLYLIGTSKLLYLTIHQVYCIYRSQPETEMSRMAGEGDVSYGRRLRCLVWPETVMSRMAGDDC